MTELNADNLRTEYLDGKGLVIEPGYLSYLRTNDYIIDSVNEYHAVKRDSSDTAHIVVNVTTYDKPRNHPDLDYVADKVDLWICDCWSYRTNSADLKDAKPSESKTCPHIQAASKVEKAKSDENQRTL